MIQSESGNSIPEPLPEPHQRPEHCQGQVHPGIAPALAQAEVRRRPGTLPFMGRRRRKGFSSVLATFYVVLFSSLAIAYTAMSNSNASISGNNRGVHAAMHASESGLAVLRYHMGGLTFAGSTTSEEVFTAIGQQMADIFNGTLNVQGSAVSYSDSQVTIPAIPIDTDLPGTTFEATITHDAANYVVTVTGRYRDISRRLQVTFIEAEVPGTGGFPTNGIISRGSIDINGSAILRSNIPGGSAVMSLDGTAWQPIHINGSGRYDGDFYMVKEGVTPGDVFNGSHEFLNAQTGTYESDPTDHVHSGIDEPEWPEVDTVIFKTLINTLPHTVIDSDRTDSSVTGSVLIPANSDVQFNGGTTIEGLVYVEWPNDLRFNGGLTITGMIVFEKPPFTPDVDDQATNSLTFNGAVQAQGPENLPDTAAYAGLRDKVHTFLLAPDADVLFNGAFGNIVGSIYTSGLRFNGATSGTIRGSLIVDRRVELSKNGAMNVYFEVDEDAKDMAGLIFPSKKTLKLVPESYQELT